MSSSPSTLHDFVLNLLSDPAAKAAFELDAQSALEGAGLGDISAVDVQEVIPLVLDTLPAVNGLPAVDGLSLEGLPTDVLDLGTAGAISQLQAVASQLTSGVSLADLNSTSATVLAADEQGLSVWGGSDTLGLLATGGATVEGDFSAVGDVTSVLDSTTAPVTGTAVDTVDTVTSTVDGVAGTATGLVPAADIAGVESVLGGTVGTVTGLVDGTLGELQGGDLSVGSTLSVTGLGQTGTAGLQVDPTQAVGNVVDTASGVVDQAGVGGVVSNVTDIAGGTALPVVDGLGVTDLLF